MREEISKIRLVSLLMKTMIGALSAVFIVLSSSPAAAQSDFAVLPVESMRRQTLESRLGSWVMAAAAGDVETLLSFALPEYRTDLWLALNDTESVEYGAMLAPTASLKSLTSASAQLSVEIFEHLNVQRLGPGVTVCHYDAALTSAPRPETLLSLLKTPDRTRRACLYWFEAEGDWYVAYDFVSWPSHAQ